MGVLKEDSKWVLPVTSAVTFLGFIDTHLLIPVIALYASSLGAGIGMVGLIVGLYSIINTPANIVFGQLIDRVGYKAPLIGGLIGNVFSMVFYAFTRSPLHLALVRVLHGASGALVAPSTMSIIAHHSVSERRGRSMSFYGMALASASLIGYPVSGLIASRLGFNALFFFGASLVGVGMLLSLMLPGGSKTAKGRSATGEIFRNVRSLLTRKGLLPSYAAIFAQYFTFGGVVTLLPVHVERLGMGAFEVGMLLAGFSAMFVITQFPSGTISDRMGRLPPIVGGLLCVILSLTALPWLASFPLLAVVMALYGAGYGLLFPSISALLTDHTGMGERGLATGLFHALLTAGVAVGAPLMGWVGGLVGTAAGLLITPVPVLLALVIALTFLRRA
ncbi:MAG: MFS transporter [Dehalococcoidia bacterium]